MEKGFTLTELLAVIIILSILLIVVIPSYNSIANSIRESNLKSTQTIISNAMLDYANKKLMDEIKPAGIDCSDQSECCKYYSIEYIVNNKIFSTAKDKKIINPKTNQPLKGCIKVCYNIDKLELESAFSDSTSNDCMEA